MKHFIRPSARDDVLRQYRYYLLEDALDAATRVLNAVDSSIADLCKMPEMGAPRAFRNPLLTGLPISVFSPHTFRWA